MANVEYRLWLQGANPNALWALSWTVFGDKLAKDIGLSALTYQNLPLKKAVQEAGGIAGMWRAMFPIAARYSVNRYGYPSGGGPPPPQFAYQPLLGNDASGMVDTRVEPLAAHVQPAAANASPAAPPHSASISAVVHGAVDMHAAPVVGNPQDSESSYYSDSDGEKQERICLE